jgi:ATP-dependent DNA helicase RecQ
MTQTPELQTALQEHFGFAAFRGVQEEVIRHVLGGSDALVIMATGDGKSLCYQLPAMVSRGLTLVVSPLIALMHDQVAALEGKGLPATCIHSMLDRQTRRERLRAALNGDVSLLYVTPERFRVEGFLEQIRKLDIALFAVDEAHCVSHWGHDFRPDYKQLSKVREALGNPTCLALTATATPDVQADIRNALGMGEARLFHTGIERPNLFLSARQVDAEEDKLQRILEVVGQVGGPGIVYTALIRSLLALEDELLRRGIRPLVYHGKLSANERREHQERFTASTDGLILATNAFGMGVDKPDIRFILHYQVPRTLEAYYQEIGRAGRDGRGSLCELLYLEEDIAIQRNFTEWANPNREFMQQVVQHLAGLGERLHAVDVQDLRETFLIKNRHDGRIETCLRLLRTAGCLRGEPGADLEWLRTPQAEELADWIPEGKHKNDLLGLLKMVQYAKEEGCRKRAIHEHFGLQLSPPCGSCDRCREIDSWLDEHLPADQRRPIPTTAGEDQAGDSDTPVRRGDWIHVRGHGLCSVTRVHVHRKNLRVDVERARDLEKRTLDLRRVSWRKVKA